MYVYQVFPTIRPSANNTSTLTVWRLWLSTHLRNKHILLFLPLVLHEDGASFAAEGSTQEPSAPNAPSLGAATRSSSLFRR